MTSQNTPTFTRTVTMTPTETPEIQAIDDLLPYPNPYDPSGGGDMTFGFTVGQNNCDAIGLKMYTASYRLVRKAMCGAAEKNSASNRKRIELKAYELGGLANGTYYYYIYSEKGGVVTRSRIDKIVIMK